MTMYTVNSLGFVTAFGQAEYMKGFEMSNAPKKVLLVKMSYEGSFFSTFVHFPAGLGILSESLTFNGIDHEFYDMQVDGSGQSFYAVIDEFQPDLIGFSMMTFNYLRNYKIIDELKIRYPHIMTIVGGAHASTFQDKILAESPGIDVVSLYEGEEILKEICHHSPLEKVGGIIYRKDGEIVRTTPRKFEQSLDHYPFPRLEKFRLEDYGTIPIVTSRGCPYPCTFCTVHLTMGKKVRARSAESAADELAYWQEQDHKLVQLNDDMFGFKRGLLEEICGQIRERGLTIKINLTNGIRADHMDYEILRLLKEANVTRVAIGVEGGNDRMLDVLRKAEKMDVIEKAISDACELGLEVQLFFVLGTPGETEQDIWDSVRVAIKYPVIAVAFNHLVPFPGTQLYDWVEKHDKFLFKAPEFLNDASSLLNSPTFTTDELNVEQRTRMHAMANKTCERHTRKVLNRLWARKLASRYPLPYAVFLPLMAIARNPAVRNFVSKSSLWSSLRQRTLDNAA